MSEKIENSEEIKELIRENSQYLWWIKEDEKENISHEFLVETILNYGSIASVKRLFELLGRDYVAEIFFKQTNRKRVNYFPEFVNLFTLYFNNAR